MKTGNYELYGLDTIDGLLFSTKILNKEDYPTDWHVDEVFPGYKVRLRWNNSIDELLDYIEKEYYTFKEGEREYLKKEMKKAEDEDRDIIITYPYGICIYLLSEYGFKEGYRVERLEDFSKSTGLTKEEITKIIEDGKKNGLDSIALPGNSKFGVRDFDRNEAIKNLNGQKFGLEKRNEIKKKYNI